MSKTTSNLKLWDQARGRAIREVPFETESVSDKRRNNHGPKIARAIGCILGAIAGTFISCHAAAANIPRGADRPRDPLFNLPYDPGQVHFDQMDLSKVGQCAPLLGNLGHGTGHTKLFGELVTGRGRVLIMGDEDPNAPRGLSGIVLVMRGNSCKTSIASFALRRNVVSDPDLDPGLTANDVSLLMKDIFVRYARAFGSKQVFLAWADRMTAEADSAYRASPDLPCPLLYTTVFTPPMMLAMDSYRAS